MEKFSINYRKYSITEPQKIYRPNGGIYLSDTKMFKKTKNFFKQKRLGYLIMNKIGH